MFFSFVWFPLNQTSICSLKCGISIKQPQKRKDGGKWICRKTMTKSFIVLLFLWSAFRGSLFRHFYMWACFIAIGKTNKSNTRSERNKKYWQNRINLTNMAWACGDTHCVASPIRNSEVVTNWCFKIFEAHWRWDLIKARLDPSGSNTERLWIHLSWVTCTPRDRRSLRQLSNPLPRPI